MTDEQQIRELIERWVAAVQSLDLDGVLAQRSAGIVMYDVPPPYRGNQGLEDYRGSWPQFFEWLSDRGTFELDTLSVVAGSDVAFAYALLRCGKPEDFATTPEMRLRLTIGLRKVDGAWLVEHEHHSYPA